MLRARVQFAANIGVRILFATIGIALGRVPSFFELRFDASGDVAHATG